MAAKQEFESRFAKHKDELEWLKFWSGRWQKPTTPAAPS